MVRSTPEAPPSSAVEERYLVKSLVHASEVLWAFQHSGEMLRLRDVMDRTGFRKGMCFRLLYTLRHCGFVEKVENNRYRLTAEIRRRKKYRIGYAAQGQDSSFAREVHTGLLRAADRAQIELVVLDNRYQPKIALRNAELLIKERVDLVIEFQTDEAVAPAIASAYQQAGIPMIAIDIPHPGATYFGANNYEAGLLAGRHLARWAKQHWSGQADEILLLELARAGSLPAARVRGIVAGIRDLLHDAASWPVVLDRCGRAIQDRARARPPPPARHEVAAHPRRGRQRSERARCGTRVPGGGRSETCAIVGQNAEPDARAELRQPRTPLIASVGYFPERYGDGLVRLALEILGRRPVAPAMFVKHQIVTKENVDHLYPNDALMGVETYARF